MPVKPRMTAAIMTLTLSSLFAQATLPPGTIDGAVNPDQIPDAVALRLFFGALVESPAVFTSTAATSTVTQPTTRQRAVILPIQLSAPDTATLFVCLQAWYGKTTGQASAGSSITLPADLDGIAQGTLNALQQQMSASGFASLMAYVRSEKKNMKRFPVPDMTQHKQ